VGKDERAADARSSGGLDGDGAGRNPDGGTEKSTPVSAVEATGHLLASLSQGSTDCAGAHQQETIRLGQRARRRVPPHRIVRESGSEIDLAGASGVRETDAERLGRVRLPPHGSPFQAIRGLTPILHWREGRRVILSERSERKDRFRATAVKPWMDSDPFGASRLRMTIGVIEVRLV